MDFIPLNRYLVVDIVENEEEDQKKILMPEGFKKKQDYIMVKVAIQDEETKKIADLVGKKVLVEKISLNTFNDGTKINFITFNHIIGYFQD